MKTVMYKTILAKALLPGDKFRYSGKTYDCIRSSDPQHHLFTMGGRGSSGDGRCWKYDFTDHRGLRTWWFVMFTAEVTLLERSTHRNSNV